MVDVDLENLVSQPTWREMLLDLVHTEQLDPWNIDIVQISDKYLERIKNLQNLDLRVPANLILAASILLRFKSQALQFEEEEQVVEQETYIEMGRPPVEIPILSLKTRIPPKRRITLNELVSAVDKVFSEMKEKMETSFVIPSAEIVQIHIPKYDIEERMNLLLEKINDLSQKDAEHLVTFTSLLEDKTPSQKVFTLLPLLHLAQGSKLYLMQEKFFGEIIIKIASETANEIGNRRGG